MFPFSDQAGNGVGNLKWISYEQKFGSLGVLETLRPSGFEVSQMEFQILDSWGIF